MKKIIVIIGPTGSGKTELSLELASKIDSEIISADSMQIYRYMDIGTAKIDLAKRNLHPHYMLDIVDPDDEYSVAEYQKNTFEIIEDILQRDRTPILVGGTGLYINSIVYNLDFSKTNGNKDIRDELWNDYENYGQDYILNILKEVDELSYKNIEHNNIKRIIRAIEVYRITGKKFSEVNENFREENEEYDFYIYGLNDERELLYNRINDRVDKMVKDGLFEEVYTLMNRYDIKSQSFKGIGYKEIVDYYNGVYSKEEAIAKLKQNSRKYAKRQITWFKRDSRINWFNLSEYNHNIENISEIIYKEVMDGK